MRITTWESKKSFEIILDPFISTLKKLKKRGNSIQRKTRRLPDEKPGRYSSLREFDDNQLYLFENIVLKSVFPKGVFNWANKKKQAIPNDLELIHNNLNSNIIRINIKLYLTFFFLALIKANNFFLFFKNKIFLIN